MSRHAAREARWASDRARLVEANRLLDLAGSSRTRLRVLTVICANDHRLIEVYRIGGVLVWVGGSVISRASTATGTRLPNGRHTARRVDLLDADSTVGNLRGPVGTCPCGNFGARAEWLATQLERDDLPASRRVVVPVKGKL